MNLEDLPVREPLSTSGTLAGLRPCDGCCVDVQARTAPELKIPAFTALTAATENYLVDAGGVVLARDVPDSVLEADVFGVLLVECESAEFAGGLGRWLRYSGLGHWASLPLVRASGCYSTAGAVFMSEGI